MLPGLALIASLRAGRLLSWFPLQALPIVSAFVTTTRPRRSSMSLQSSAISSKVRSLVQKADWIRFRFCPLSEARIAARSSAENGSGSYFFVLLRLRVLKPISRLDSMSSRSPAAFSAMRKTDRILARLVSFRMQKLEALYGSPIAQPRNRLTSNFPSLRTSSNRIRRFFMTSSCSAVFIGRAFQSSRTTSTGTGRYWCTLCHGHLNRTSRHCV